MLVSDLANAGGGSSGRMRTNAIDFGDFTSTGEVGLTTMEVRILLN